MKQDILTKAQDVAQRTREATVRQIAEAEFSHLVAPLCQNLLALEAALALLPTLPVDPEPEPVVESQPAETRPAATKRTTKKETA